MQRCAISAMQELLSRTDDPKVSLRGQEFYELRLYESEPDGGGKRYRQNGEVDSRGRLKQRPIPNPHTSRTVIASPGHRS
jgi:hypothetical protein